MEYIKKFDEMNSATDYGSREYPVYFVVKRFVYDKDHRNGWWREEEMFESISDCRNYIQRESSYNKNGETGRFGIYRMQLVEFVGEE